MPTNVAPLRVVMNADGTGTIAEMNAQDIIALQNLVTSLRLLGGLTPTAGRIPIFTGDNAASVVALSANGAFFDCIPKIGGDGVIEIGSIIDFHMASNETVDFFMRLAVDANGFTRRGTNDGRVFRLYDHGSIVGGVGQTNRVPTGSIIESGGTATSRYIRYADGSQVCHGAINNGTSQTTDGSTAGFHKYVGMGQFAAAFSSVPRVSYGLLAAQSYYGLVGCDAPHSTTATASTYLWSPSNTFQGQASYIAVGRWFE